MSARPSRASRPPTASADSSPSASASRATTSYPSVRARPAAASTAVAFEPSSTCSTRHPWALVHTSAGGAGTTASLRSRSSIRKSVGPTPAAIAPYRSRIASASAARGGTGRQGADAMRSSGSPMMSDSTITTSRPARQTRASPPPFTSLAACRTTLSSRMSAPARERKPVTAIFSSSGSPGRGATRQAEPPPVISATATSSGPRPASTDRIAAVASTAAGVGRLTAAGRVARTSILPSPALTTPSPLPAGTLSSPSARPPWLVTTTRARPRARPAAAFPAPTTTSRPPRGMTASGRPSTDSAPCRTARRRRMSRSGSTDSSAACRIAATSPSHPFIGRPTAAGSARSSGRSARGRCRRATPPREA